MKIKELRKDNKMSSEEIAKYLGISVQAYYRYENETNEPSVENLIKLADRYNVSIDYLVGRVWRDEIGYLTPEQRETVNELKRLSEINLFKATAYIKGLIAGQESKER